MNIQIMTVGSEPIIGHDDLVTHARQRWPDVTTAIDDLGVHAVRVEPDGFTMNLWPNARLFVADGDWDQNLETAAWLATLIDPAVRVIVIGNDASWHTELRSGITAEEVYSERIDHTDPDDDWPISDPGIDEKATWAP